VPWAAPRRPTDAKKEVRGRTLDPHVTFMPVSECWMKHVLGIRHDGHIFVFEPARNGGRPPRKLREYLPTGALAREDPIIWKVSDGCVGPKFDANGNIYIADIVKPVDAVYPEVFRQQFGEVKLETDVKEGSPKDNTANMYGSILKFTPKGGMIHFPDNIRITGVGGRPFAGEPKLDPTLKTVAAAYYARGRLRPVNVTGAEWIHPGYNHVEVRGCTCESTRFDVDGFGRVWYPDLGRFRVCVIDTEGNEITHFGRYGNADADGISFSWLTGVGVTDRHIYTSDGLNRCLLRLTQTYAAEATCPVPMTD
jgi:hypothetical protein